MRHALGVSLFCCTLFAGILPDSALAATPETEIRAVAETSAVDPARLDLGRQFIAVMFPPDKQDAMLAAVMEALLAQQRASITLPPLFNDPGLKRIIEEAFSSIPTRLAPALSLHFPRIHEATARAYAREFSLAELTELVAFARTPAGEHYLLSANALVSDSDVAAANTAYFAEVHVITRQFTAELRQKLMDYQEKHPEIAVPPKAKPR